mmetsp:Transcript_42065/g.118955  ORF Transcript_42065/g.118955 Transcript_42065/m.118955 type:complete len:229 (+) Transcript_42065:94-780(+)
MEKSFSPILPNPGGNAVGVGTRSLEPPEVGLRVGQQSCDLGRAGALAEPMPELFLVGLVEDFVELLVVALVRVKVRHVEALRAQLLPQELARRLVDLADLARRGYELERDDHELGGREVLEVPLEVVRVQRGLDEVPAVGKRGVILDRLPPLRPRLRVDPLMSEAPQDPVGHRPEGHHVDLHAPVLLIGVVVVGQQALHGLADLVHELQPRRVVPVPLRDQRRHRGVD